MPIFISHSVTAGEDVGWLVCWAGEGDANTIPITVYFGGELYLYRQPQGGICQAGSAWWGADGCPDQVGFGFWFEAYPCQPVEYLWTGIHGTRSCYEPGIPYPPHLGLFAADGNRARASGWLWADPMPTPPLTPTATPTPSPTPECQPCRPLRTDLPPAGDWEIELIPGECYTIMPGFYWEGAEILGIQVGPIDLPQVTVCVTWVSLRASLFGIDVAAIIAAVATLVAIAVILSVLGGI